jgi:hypothetical protein
MKLPLLRKKSIFFPKVSKCPMCYKKFAGDFIAFNFGALLSLDKNRNTMSDRLIGFCSVVSHRDSKRTYHVVDIATNLNSGQGEFYTCSVKCMKKLFNNIFDTVSEKLKDS